MEKIKIKDLENEQWLPVVGYEGLYECSNLGRIKGVQFRKEHLMKQRHDKDGYLAIGLYKDGKQKFFQAHRVIGQAFLPNPDGLPEINHKNEIKDDNRVENIEWCTHSYNMNYGSAIERASQSKKKPVLCVETGAIYPSAIEASLACNVDRSSIQQACARQGTCCGLHWIYPEESENKC